MRFGVKDIVLEKLSEVFEKNIGVIKALLYGSETMGNYFPDGDIEIAIVGDLNLEELKKIGREIKLLQLPNKFNLCLYHQLEDKYLIEHIDRVGVVIYKNKMADAEN